MLLMIFQKWEQKENWKLGEDIGQKREEELVTEAFRAISTEQRDRRS